MPRQVVRCAECLTWSKRPAVVAEPLHCPRCHNVVCWPDRWAEEPSGQNETPATNAPRPPTSSAQTRESVRAELLQAEPAKPPRRRARSRWARTLSWLAPALWCVLWAGVAWAGWLDGAACVLLGLAGVALMVPWRR